MMLADNSTDRKVTLSKSHMVTKTKYKAAAKVSLTVELPPREGGLPYIVVVSTFDPQLLGRFTLLKKELPAPEEGREPFFALISRSPEGWMAARGRGGGLAFWTLRD